MAWALTPCSQVARQPSFSEIVTPNKIAFWWTDAATAYCSSGHRTWGATPGPKICRLRGSGAVARQGPPLGATQAIVAPASRPIVVSALAMLLSLLVAQAVITPSNSCR